MLKNNISKISALIILVILVCIFIFRPTKDTVSFTHESPGGSGTFYYVASSVKDSKPYFIGDRISPKTIVQDGDAYVVSYLDRGPNDSFADEPTVHKTISLKFDSVKKEFLPLYINKKLGFSAVVPIDIKIEELENSVKFTIPEDLSDGTNLSKDTNISIESSTECKASKSSEGAAGNYYVEEIFVLRKSPCLVAHYFIHSTQLLNYPEGTKVAFDRTAILSLFDSIKSSIKILTI